MSGANNSPLSALLKGVLTSFILTFIVFTVYAILLTYTSLQYNTDFHLFLQEYLYDYMNAQLKPLVPRHTLSY